MALLGYNRRLLWVVIPAVLWAFLGLSAALGPPAGPGQPGFKPPVQFGVGPADGGVYARGSVRRLVEERDLLVVTLELPPGAQRVVTGPNNQPVKNLPPGLAVEYVAPGELPAGPPELRLHSGLRHPRRLPGGGEGLLTDRFIVRIDAKGVRIAPRPPGMRPSRGADGRGSPGDERERPRDRIRDRARDWLQRGREEQPAPPAGERRGG